MKVLLLAAGLGTRLRPITDKIPKCLVPVCGKPLLGYWLELLTQAGIEKILVNTHYLPESVRNFIRIQPESILSRVSLVHEESLLGTGGTVLRNRDYFGREPFIVAHADNLTLFDVRAFINAHRGRPPGTAITMMTFSTDVPRSCGVVEIDNDGVVRAFHEKVENPPSNIANAAVYIFEPEVVDYIDGLGKSFVDLSTEVIPYYVGRIAAYYNNQYHRDIGTPESLRIAEREFASVLVHN